MNINKAFPSRYLKADDFDQGERTLTISHVDLEEMAQTGEQKAVLYFFEEDQRLVLNRTNANTIEDLYGTETTAWEGKSITVFATKTEFGGKRVPCLRMKAPTAPPAPQQAAVPTTAPPNNMADANAELAAAADQQQGVPFA